MKELLKKEEQLIFKPIEELITRLLHDGFKNRKGHVVSKIDGITLEQLDCDKEKSEFKKQILIDKVLVFVKVWVKSHEDSTTNDNLTLSLNKQIEMSFDFDKHEYVLENEKELALIDKSY